MRPRCDRVPGEPGIGFSQARPCGPRRVGGRVVVLGGRRCQTESVSVELPSGTVTFLFTDIKGSTRLLTRLRERYADVLADQQRLLRMEMQR